MPDQDSNTIFAVFDTFALAHAAARFLKTWEKSQPDVKFTSLSLVHLNLLHDEGGGQVKIRNYSRRNTLQGVETGVIVGLILGLVAGRMAGVALFRATLAGAALGAAAGALTRQDPGLSSEDLDALRPHLTSNSPLTATPHMPIVRSGLIIRLERGQVDRVVDEIKRLDGEVKNVDLHPASAPIPRLAFSSPA